MVEEATGPLPNVCTCQPPSDVWLDRTYCACGDMHFYCECGRRTDACPLDEALP